MKKENIVASQIEWAYLAGIVDGEGCIRAVEEKVTPRNIRQGNVSPRFRIELHITNTSEKLINWVHERFGGNIYLTHKPGQYRATKNCWRIVYFRNAAEILLKGMYPYLLIKKDQADLCFKLRDLVRSRDPRIARTGTGYILTPEMISSRREIVQALKDAKKVQ